MSDALSTIVTSLTPISETETIPSSSSLHRILCADVSSPSPHPPFRASIKDGYAVSSSAPWSPDAVFTLVGSALAGGATPTLASGQRECVYITTGAPLPAGADAVVMVEQSRPCAGGAGVSFESWVSAPGADVRQVGSDIAQGEVVLPQGARVGAAELGLLVACGVAAVDVVRRVRVGVVSTGDEVVDAAEAARRGGVGKEGTVVDSNRPMLLAAVAEALPWCEAVDLGIVRDEYGEVKETLGRALEECDVVLTSGGVSMGSRDVVKPVLGEIGTVHFGRVCMKPGKPLTFATAETARGRSCVVGLPGNPVSAFVCFHLAVAAAARRLAGVDVERALGNVVEARLAHDFKLDKQRPEYHRVTLEWKDGGYVATSTGSQASSRLLSARSAGGLLSLPASDGVQAAGSVRPVYIL